MSRSILSLSKIAHQIWCDHPFSQRNKETERTMRLGVRGDREVVGGGNIRKMGLAIGGVK